MKMNDNKMGTEIIRYLETELNNKTLEVEDRLKLLKSSKIKNALKNFFNSNSKISSNDLKKISTNNEVINLLETYALENDIIVEDDYEIDINDSLGYIYYEAKKIPIYTKKEEKEIFYKYQTTKDIEEKTKLKDDIITHNLKLVLNIAHRFAKNQQGNPSMNIQDYFQEGVLGLMKAIDYFDLSRDCKFSTFATLYVKQRIDRERMNKSRTIRMPVFAYDVEKAISIIKDEYFLKNGEEINFTDDVIEKISEVSGVSIQTVKLIASRKTLLSLEATIENEDDETTYASFVKDEGLSVEDTVLANVQKEEIDNLLNTSGLNEQEKIVIIKRFGLQGNEPMTLASIASIFNVSGERIRQIEAKSLKKLKTVAAKRNLSI